MLYALCDVFLEDVALHLHSLPTSKSQTEALIFTLNRLQLNHLPERSSSY